MVKRSTCKTVNDIIRRRIGKYAESIQRPNPVAIITGELAKIQLPAEHR